ncbi:ABC transporter ATP-binding protein [Cumulibacter manganitolerans]|uniref:ABC transporter ATP-binding protein n=1 Tax=Cumulibacter manganitolerans TaxID=1884992 RepID=UPI0012954E2D|nr:ABC transporter ATP-binding protein [Cumulibacter manganitolerans]
MSTPDWRGVAAEDVADLDASVSLLLRGRSRRLLESLLRPYKRPLWITAAAILAQNLAVLAAPWLVGVGIDWAIPALRRGDWGPLWTTFAAVLLAAVLAAVLRSYFLRSLGRLGQRVLLDLRRRLFWHFQRLPLAFHDKYTSGRVISRQTSDLDSLNELLDAGLDGLITALLSVLSVTVILTVLDPSLALVVLLALPVVVAILHWFRVRSTTAYRRTRETSAAFIVQFVETFGGIRAVQTFRRERRNTEIFHDLNEDNRAANEHAYRLFSIFVPAIKMTGNLAMAVCLVYGGLRVVDGDLRLGVLAAFMLYLRQFFDPMVDLGMFYNSYQSGMAALEKLSGVLEEPSSVPAPEHPTPLPKARGEVVLDDVEFAYSAEAGDVLPRLDLTLRAGQTVALVGATGAGKSTIARLVCRFYDPQRGAVRLDGVDLRELADDDLRRAIVMVTQESFLFSGTVADNIAIGKPSATRAEIERAARALGAHDFISRLPDGYDTDVRKRGGRLSAGQRQLVAFARAFLADPAVLILDEATSSLDVPSERLVQAALETILADRTAVIIAHRLSTVEIADRVLVLDAGEVVEDGTPHELIAGSGRFARLHGAWKDSLV